MAPKKKLPGCSYITPGEARCGSGIIHAHGYCYSHVQHAPEERSLVSLLGDQIRAAKARRDDLGEEILRRIVFGSESDEDLRRDYRVLWHRHEYLIRVRNDRRPGDELPAEVMMR